MRVYLIDGLEMNRTDYINFLCDVIEENDLVALIGCESLEQAKRRVNARPLCTGRALGFNVYTYIK